MLNNTKVVGDNIIQFLWFVHPTKWVRPYFIRVNNESVCYIKRSALGLTLGFSNKCASNSYNFHLDYCSHQTMFLEKKEKT